jgi:anti-sigma-K factor RskA
MSDDLEDSVAAHALHALPSDETLIVETAIHVDPDLQAEYEAHRSVAVKLASGFPEVVPVMSPALWTRISRSAGLQGVSAVPVDEERASRSRWPISLVAGVAALLILFALSVALLSQSDTTPTLGDVAAAAAAQPGAETVALQDPGSAQTMMSAVVSADGESYLISEVLPALSADRTYQLWVIVDDRIISAGVLGSAPTVNPFRVEGDILGLAVTEEIAGGVAVSENDPVALWLAEA